MNASTESRVFVHYKMQIPGLSHLEDVTKLLKVEENRHFCKQKNGEKGLGTTQGQNKNIIVKGVQSLTTKLKRAMERSTKAMSTNHVTPFTDLTIASTESQTTLTEISVLEEEETVNTRKDNNLKTVETKLEAVKTVTYEKNDWFLIACFTGGAALLIIIIVTVMVIMWRKRRAMRRRMEQHKDVNPVYGVYHRGWYGEGDYGDGDNV